MRPFSSFGLGTLHFGSLLDRQASKEIVFEAIDQGITFFDTAPLYGNTYAEEILGEALAEIRQEVCVCTKVGLRCIERKNQRFGVEVARLNAATLKQSVETSLKRLKRDTIDLLMLHAFDRVTPLSETLTALTALYHEGKIKSFGCSNYNPQQLRQLLRSAPLDPPFLAAQCHYNMIERRAGRSFIPLCEKNKTWVIVNRALARGALSGQYGMGQAVKEGSRAAKSPRIRQWLTPEKLQLLDALVSIAQASNTPLTQISLKWLLKNHAQMVVLLGVRDKAQLKGCLHAASTEIDALIFEQIETILTKRPELYTMPPRYFEK